MQEGKHKETRIWFLQLSIHHALPPDLLLHASLIPQLSTSRSSPSRHGCPSLTVSSCAFIHLTSVGWRSIKTVASGFLPGDLQDAGRPGRRVCRAAGHGSRVRRAAAPPQQRLRRHGRPPSCRSCRGPSCALQPYVYFPYGVRTGCYERQAPPGLAHGPRS